VEDGCWKTEDGSKDTSRAHLASIRVTLLWFSAKCNFLKFAATSCEISRNKVGDLFQEISGNFTKFQQITANCVKFHGFGRFPYSVPPIAFRRQFPLNLQP